MVALALVAAKGLLWWLATYAVEPDPVANRPALGKL
jgi:hypothetical protein